MDTSRGRNGIQLLLAAEQEAQQIVNAARNAKLARLKQAKEEAEKEVAEFRAQMEADFQKKLAETSGDSGANVKRLEKETEEKIQHLKTEADRISHDVVDMLMKLVTSVSSGLFCSDPVTRINMAYSFDGTHEESTKLIDSCNPNPPTGETLPDMGN
ncbi:V-type proton ATPase subunit G 1-like protein [Tanacetum coccineum]